MSYLPLVPEKTYAVCSNGLMTGEVVVGSQTTVKTSDDRLIATINDKPTNFKCKYLGILLAAIGGFIAAMIATGVGGLIAGVLLATVIAAAITYGIGGAICAMCLKSAMWDIMHPMILIEGQPAIIAKSKLICIPLGLPAGSISLYYSKDVANRVARITAIQNITEMFAFAGLGAALPALGSALGSVYSFCFAASGSAVIAGTATIGASVGLYKGGEIISMPIKDLENAASDFLAGVNTVPEEPKKVDAISNAEVVEDLLKSPKIYKIANTKALREYNIGSRSPIMKDMWIRIKADPSYSSQTKNALQSKYLTEVKAEYKQLNNRLSNRAARGAVWKKAVKNNLIMMGFSSGVNIISETITKGMQKELAAMQDYTENAAMKKIKIYEEQV